MSAIALRGINLKNGYSLASWGNKRIKRLVLLFSLILLLIACGESEESEDVVFIDPSYLTSPEPPSVDYPLQIEDEFEIKVGELFGYENVDWDSYFSWEYSITSPEIIEGEGKICTRAEDGFSVLGESPGSCSLKYPSSNGENEGFIFLAIEIIEG